MRKMKIHTVGGYEKVGANMTAVEVDGKIVILDMGADIERVVDHGQNVEEMKTIETIETGIVPDDSKIKERREDVEAIVIGHGHQDHCRGIPKLANAYDCPIITAPYTADIIERFIENDRENVKNEIKRLEPGSEFQISDNFHLELVPITHSIPHACMIVLRTTDGNVAYSLDFKLDENPTLGDPIDYDKLNDLGDVGIDAYIADCTRADQSGETDSELDAKKELIDILSSAKHHHDGIIVTMFSSHIARLRNVIEANNWERDIVLLGRSLKEYTADAERNDLIDLSRIKVGSYRDEVESILKDISRNKSDYLLVTTGNQGEPNAMLSRIADQQYPFQVSPRDLVIFSSVTIPTPVNELNREYLKNRLKQEGANLKLDVHSHGHAKSEGHKKMINLLDPNCIVPAHGGGEKLSSLANLAREEGVDEVKVSKNGGEIRIN